MTPSLLCAVAVGALLGDTARISTYDIGLRALPLTLLERSAQGHVTELHRDSPSPRAVRAHLTTPASGARGMRWQGHQGPQPAGPPLCT